MAERIVGEVKWFNDDKGFGFIITDDEPIEEYFVHFTSVKMDGFKTLKANQRVSFELLETPKGVQAVEVMID